MNNKGALFAVAAICCVSALSRPATALGSELPDGRYVVPGGFLYVGRTAEPPTDPELEYYDTTTDRLGTLVPVGDGRYRTKEKPELEFALQLPGIAVSEDKHLVDTSAGPFGFSVWHEPAAARRPLIVLLEGADDSTRDMGFLIPYFVAHGMNVLTYDQRGTGVSVGNWQFTSPVEKANDVLAALHSLSGDASIDFASVGVWGPSNGGWVAPIVATNYPLAFEILKSSSSGTIAANVMYEIRQDLVHTGRFSPQQIDDAMRFDATMFEAVKTGEHWKKAGDALAAARTQPWFPFMRVPPGVTAPPPAPMLAALQASLIYDPESTLERVTTPTLALFGQFDRSVDAATDAPGFRTAFGKAGMTDLTIHVFPGADHLLMASANGYESDELDPARFVSGYPAIMIDWLHHRGWASP
jgi:alpha-beta hydrolase superfamily lysophospholipase